MGSSLSLRTYARIGSAVSLVGRARLGSTLSLLSYANVGSTLSIRSYSRVSGQMSLMTVAYMGSSLSLRAYSRLGSSVSTMGCFRMASSLSLYDFVDIGSSMSLRSFARIGGSVSLGLNAKLHLSRADTYIGMGAGPAGGMEFTVGGTKAMDMTYDSGGGVVGGHLYGTWSADNTVSTSDRRLKTSIVDLRRSLVTELSPQKQEQAPVSSAVVAGDRAAWSSNAKDGPPKDADRAKTVSWVLRELRPVSFKFKKGPEAKYSRFGFIAQEVQQVLPSMVRDTADGKHLAVIYQDLIALLTLAHQVLEDKVTTLQTVADELEAKNAEHEASIEALNAKIDLLIKKPDERPEARVAQQPATVPVPTAAGDSQQNNQQLLQMLLQQQAKLQELEAKLVSQAVQSDSRIESSNATSMTSESIAEQTTTETASKPIPDTRTQVGSSERRLRRGVIV